MILYPRSICPRCQTATMLVRITPGPSGFDIRTFECPACNYIHQAVAELVDPMRSSRTTAWLRGQFWHQRKQPVRSPRGPRSSWSLLNWTLSPAAGKLLNWRLFYEKCLKLHSGDSILLPFICDARARDQFTERARTGLQWLRCADEAFGRPSQLWNASGRTDISLRWLP
jgi:hypothetical protein